MVSFLVGGMRIGRTFFTDRVNKTPYIYMSRGEYAFGGILPGVTGPEPAGDRASLRAERVTGYSGSDKYYK